MQQRFEILYSMRALMQPSLCSGDFSLKLLEFLSEPRGDSRKSLCTGHHRTRFLGYRFKLWGYWYVWDGNDQQIRCCRSIEQVAVDESWKMESRIVILTGYVVDMATANLFLAEELHIFFPCIVLAIRTSTSVTSSAFFSIFSVFLPKNSKK